jgi:branched-chain amino acid transport system substrate-binding protein
LCTILLLEKKRKQPLNDLGVFLEEEEATMKRLLAALSLLMVAGVALGACAAPFECTDAIGCVDIAPGDPIHIGAMLTISGATAFLGEDSRGAVEIAIADRDAELLDHPLQLTVEDSLCSAEGGQTAATKITADPTIIGVIGTNCSSAMTAAMSTISASGLVILSPSNTAPALTLIGEDYTWEPGYFRVCHTDLFQGAVAAEFAYNELGARTLATIHDGSPYADQLQEVMATKFAELGGTVTFQGAVNVGDTDMRTILTTVAADTPDVLYFPIFEPEGPFIVAQSSEISGLEDTTLIGADGLYVASFPENSGANAIGMYLSGPYIGGADYDAFLAKWEDQIGGVPPSGFHAFAYDATNILLDAIEAVAVVDRDGTVHIGRQALRDAVSATTGFAGLTGSLDCGEKDFGEGLHAMSDCATGEALGVYQITAAEVNDDNWPPPVIYTP